MDILNFILGAIVLVVGGVAALLLGSLKALRDSNKDLRDRSDDQDRKIADLTAEVSLLTADRDALGRQVRGDDALRAITSKLEEHHEEAKVHWARDEALLHAVVDQLTTGEPPHER